MTSSASSPPSCLEGKRWEKVTHKKAPEHNENFILCATKAALKYSH